MRSVAGPPLELTTARRGLLPPPGLLPKDTLAGGLLGEPPARDLSAPDLHPGEIEGFVHLDAGSGHHEVRVAL